MKFRFYLALAGLALLLAFAMQNSDRLTIRLLFWSFQISQALLIIACGGLGLLAGWLLKASGRKS